MSKGIHPAIMGLIQELPPTGSFWPKQRQDAWLRAMAAVLEVIYPSPLTVPARMYGTNIVTLHEPRREPHQVAMEQARRVSTEAG